MQIASASSLFAETSTHTAVTRLKPLEGIQVPIFRSESTPVFDDVGFVFFEPNFPCCVRRHRRQVKGACSVTVEEPKSTVHTGHKSKMAQKKVQNGSEGGIVQITDGGYHQIVQLLVDVTGFSRMLVGCTKVGQQGQKRPEVQN